MQKINRFSISVYEWVIYFIVWCAISPCLFAEDFDRLDHQGLEGQKILTIAVGPGTKPALWVGSERGMFRKDPAGDEAWQKIMLGDDVDVQVRQIVFSDDVSCVYAATSKGIFEIDLANLAADKIYSSNQDAEQDCASVAVDADGNIYAATRGGLYAKPKRGRRWSKNMTDLGEKSIDYVYASGKIIYAAVYDGLYRSQDGARTWAKVFRINTTSEEIADGMDAFEEADGDRIHCLIAQKGEPSTLYLATIEGVFKSEDSGLSWSRLPLSGLDSKDVQDCVLSPGAPDIYAVTRTGVFEFKEDGWRLKVPLYGGRRIVLVSHRLYVAALSGIFALSTGGLKKDIDDPQRYPAINIEGEPTIQDVQQMVIKYCDVENDKIQTWHKQARARAFLPDLSFGYGNNVYGSYNGLFAVGPNDWQVNVSWDLADLVYSTDQTSIDTRSRLTVQLRNDVLAEATQLYFERKRLLIELSGQTYAPTNRSEKYTRLEELTALLDRLTGGAFSKVLKSGL
ncbi:MAG: hypothetical protein PHS61_00060 [Candidatus Omnitrophica bacterium]|nr:hypothetical protein [Candidatus Omnitrophota bacterium]